MKKTILFLIFVLCAISANAVRINEIMYNPQGDDYDFEFIELYFENQTNASGFYFEGIDFVFPENTTLSGHVVIANTLSNFLQRYGNITPYEYGGALANDGEEITLFGNGSEIIDSAGYTNIANEGYSIERTFSGWAVSSDLGGTPGTENTHTYNFSDENNTSNETNTTLDPSIEIELQKTSYLNKEQIAIKHRVYDATAFSIEYWIDDIFNETVKQKQVTTNTNTKYYTPSIDEKDKVLVIKAVLKAENDSNLSNNYAEVFVFVSNPDYEEESESTEDEEAEDNNEESAEKQKNPEITSFYTLSKTFKQTNSIKLFAYAKNPEADSEFSAELVQNNITVDIQHIFIEKGSSKRLVFEAVLDAGSNNFSLLLLKGGILIDSSKLDLLAESIEKPSLINEPQTKEKFINTSPELELNAQEIELKKEGSGSKINIASYLVLGLSVALNTILIWRR
ncbi:lamin tail domain-containing protein [Candidatus Woesearchaeota archaeon]|nr:lamin tail domain-containing protein [Candidatus Woesearchaeota archaeon]